MVAAAVPPYPSESELAAAEVTSCAWGRSGGPIHRSLASRPLQPRSLSPVQDPLRILRCAARIHAWIRSTATGSAHVGRGAAAGCAASSPPPSPPPPQSPVATAPTARPCRICRHRARRRSVVEVESPRLPPTVARHRCARKCAVPDPSTPRPLPLDGRGGAATPPACRCASIVARHHCARSRAVLDPPPTCRCRARRRPSPLTHRLSLISKKSDWDMRLVTGWGNNTCICMLKSWVTLIKKITRTMGVGEGAQGWDRDWSSMS